MKSSLKSRVERLEAVLLAKEPDTVCYGWLTHLPEDFTGERHVVTVKRKPTSSPHALWCEFEERPGPAPPGSHRPEESSGSNPAANRNLPWIQRRRARRGRSRAGRRVA